MNKFSILLVATSLSLISCKPQRYQIVSMNAKIIEINESFDTNHGNNTELEELVNHHKEILDKQMNEVIGKSNNFMAYGYPESPLTNFTSDVMKAYGDKHLSTGADLAVMNVHGHRATMPQGSVTLGNLYEIYSFDNTVAFIKLKGDELNKIFDAYARMGGSGISSNVKLVINNKKVKSVTIDGKKIDKNKVYNIATLDYLADGNNGMDAFLNADEVEDTGITLRDVMIEYVKEQTQQGNKLSSKNDGRIIVEN